MCLGAPARRTSLVVQGGVRHVKFSSGGPGGNTCWRLKKNPGRRAGGMNPGSRAGGLKENPWQEQLAEDPWVAVAGTVGGRSKTVFPVLDWFLTRFPAHRSLCSAV